MDANQAVRLTQAIREHVELELDSIRNAARYGADSGFPGFTYYTDCAAFYDSNESLLWELLADEADEFGFDSIPAFITSWNPTYAGVDELTYKNQVSWYALETAGRFWLDRRENRSYV